MKLLNECLLLAVLLIAVPIGDASAPAGPWDVFNYSPSNRSAVAASIYSTNGTVEGASELIDNMFGNATFSEDGSYVVLDFGKEVCLSISFIPINQLNSMQRSEAASP